MTKCLKLNTSGALAFCFFRYFLFPTALTGKMVHKLIRKVKHENYVKKWQNNETDAILVSPLSK